MSEWVILELSPRAEGEDPDIIRRSVRNFVRGAEVFVPASVTQIGDDRVVQYLVEGYAFIRRDHPDQNYLRLEGSRYVQSVITSPGTSEKGRPMRKVACVQAADIERMRSQIQAESNQGIGVGDTVRITSGVYRQIMATVIEDIPELDKVQVEVRLRSKESLVTLPRSFLQLVSKAPRPAYMDRVDRLRTWIQMALSFVRWPTDGFRALTRKNKVLARMTKWLVRGNALTKAVQAFNPQIDFGVMASLLKKVTILSAWLQQGQERTAFIRAYDASFNLNLIDKQRARFERLFLWVDRGKKLTELVTLAYPSWTLSPLESKYLEWDWLRDTASRLYRIEREVDAIGRVYEGKKGGTSVQNIIVDGHNLAFRCLYAPGMDALADSKGRPTGILVGFLRGLGALKKRYPDAHICVCWDGSSKRRRQVFPAYKANRGERTSLNGEFNQIGWLQETLPSLGIEQAFNPEEEADDVIAALVRGMFKGQRNVVYTTDRDMLQLVTATDNQLVPAVGGKKELLYDVDAVVRDYGVPPERMVMLRAFLGDSSDNIPGVPRVPTKVLTNLVRLYNSVDKVYSSSLAGLTKLQYEKLREAEAQVRLNIRLMSLDTETDFVLTGPDPNQNVALERLQDVEIKAEPILAAFLNRAAGFDEQRAEAHDQRLRDSGGSSGAEQPIRSQR